MDTEAIREHVMPILRDAEKHVMRGDRIVGFDAALLASMQAGRVAHNIALRRRMHSERQYDTLCVCAALLLTGGPARATMPAIEDACQTAMRVSDYIANALMGGDDAAKKEDGRQTGTAEKGA